MKRWPIIRTAIAVGIVIGPFAWLRADAVEPDDTAAQATALTIGVTHGDAIQRAGDIDIFRFTAVAGGAYQIETSNLRSSMDTIITLYGSDGRAIAEDDDGGAGYASLISYTAAQAGTHYVRVRHYSATATTGQYDITVRGPSGGGGTPTDDHGGAIATATTLTLNQAVAGTFERAGDEDFFGFNAVAGARYEIETSALGSGADTFIHLLGAQGAQIAQDDDGGAERLASRIDHTATASGPLFVRVRHYSATGTGTYRIVARGQAGTQLTGRAIDRATGRGIAGALIRIQGQPTNLAVADAQGRFSFDPAAVPAVARVTAGAVGFKTAGVRWVPGTVNLEMQLEALQAIDDPSYVFVEPETCQTCHVDKYDQWKASGHSRAATNSWVLEIYREDFRRGQEQGAVNFEDGFDECAGCHSPTAASRSTDAKHRDVRLDQVRGVDAKGVSCDFCHKTQRVEVNNRAGVYGNHFLLRPTQATRDPTNPSAIEHAFGPLPDVDFAIMGASYNPQFDESSFCSSCHQDTAHGGLPNENTYAEWLASPYATGPNARTCQDCHMASDGTERFIANINGVPRDPSTVHRHDVKGIDAALIRSALDLDVRREIVGSKLRVTVDVENTGAGHNVPTGFAARQLMLLVLPRDASGNLLRQTSGTTLSSNAGAAAASATLAQRLSSGDVAGLPGKDYRKRYDGWDILGTRSDQTYVPFWRATSVVGDNWLAPFRPETNVFEFDLPATGSDVQLDVRFVHRRIDKKSYDQLDLSRLVGGANGHEPLDLEFFRHDERVPIPGRGPTDLTLGGEVTGTLAGPGDGRVYRFTAQPGETVRLFLSGGGDFDVYVKRGSPPTTTDYDYASDAAGTSAEQVDLFDAGGEYYVLVVARSGSGAFRLRSTTSRTSGGLAVRVTAAPTEASAGGAFTVRWEVSGAQSVTHTNVHWGETPGTFDQFAPASAGGSGAYTNTITAPARETAIYFVVHVRADGQDVYTTSRTVSVRQTTPPPAITTGSLPDGRVGAAYAATVQASGGAPPYRWSASGLPAGLAIDAATGRIAGAPTASGTRAFTVTVADQAGRNASVSLSINVAPGSSGPQTFTKDENPNLAIRDNRTVTSSLAVPASLVISDISVFVDISHTYVGDLTVTLVSPSGRRVVLHQQSGEDRDDIRGDAPLDVSPAQSLDVLRGQNAQGTWRLEVTDSADQDQGTLNLWRLIFDDTPVSSSNYLKIIDDHTPRNHNLIRDGYCVRINGGGKREWTVQARAHEFTTGADGIPGNADDRDLGPASNVTWSLTVPSSVATISPSGLITSGPRTGQGRIEATHPTLGRARSTLRVLPPSWGDPNSPFGRP